MIDFTKIFIFLLALVMLPSCDKTSKSTNANIATRSADAPRDIPDEIDAYYLFMLAKDSNLNRDFDESVYSKTVSLCCLIGLTERCPINFINEQRGVDFLTSFDMDDPLGWADDLESGAFITIHADLGLIVLEYPQNPKTGIRDIKDVIQYSAGSYPEIDTDFYPELSAIIFRCFNEATAQYNDLISKSNQESEREISD